MTSHLPAVDPRLTFRVADGLGIIPGGSPRDDLQAWRRAGKAAALTLPQARPGAATARQIRRRTARLRLDLQAAMARSYLSTDVRAWLTDNARLIASAESEARDFLWNSHDYPSVTMGRTERPRVSALVAAYLDEAARSCFGEEAFAAFLRGAQDAHDLQLGELWAARGALMLELLERTVAAAADEDERRLPSAIDSIRHVSDANWKQLFASSSVVDQVLVADPAGAFAAMDDTSRDTYRHAVSYLARYGAASEREVAEAAVSLADEVAEAHPSQADDAARRRMHVGYYLMDDGLATLEALVGFRAPLLRRVAQVVTTRPLAFYLGGIVTVTLAIVVSMLQGLDVAASAWVALLLVLPATQAAVEFINALVPAATRPRVLAKLDFSKGIPADCRTMVAVPALLLNEQHVHELVMDLEIRYLANRDPHLHFALLSDSVDAADKAGAAHEPLVPLAEALVEGLNARYGTPGRTPFYLFHRHRIYNPSEQRWMGWERKRGKLLDLNRLLRGGFDSFPVKVGETDVLHDIRYVITLDSDTQLPRDSAHRLVGAIAHPLNRAVVDPAKGQVAEGYGILQPRIGISTQSASRSWLARLLSGETGIDTYTRAISDPYQDLFGEGSYTGKGIYDVDAFHAVLEHRFPENALLSHDLIEGIVARAGLVSDIELIDDYPTHFNAYSRRKHRWMRGDWQIMRWVMPRVPDGLGRTVENHFNTISRWKILDNLRRSLLEPATLILLLAGWFVLRGGAALWTTLSVAMLLMPIYGGLAVAMIRAPWGRSGFVQWGRDTFVAFARQHLMVVLTLTFLLHDALLAVDAIVRSLARVFVTRQRLLEWETAAETRHAGAGPKRAADVYLDWSPAMVLAVVAALAAFSPSSLSAAAPVLALWMCARPLAAWLSRAPRNGAAAVSADDEVWLRTQAWRMWRYFREFSTARRNWLVPDHVIEDGVAAERLSPTNLGFLLDARVAAVHLGHLTVDEFARDTRWTLEGLSKLPLVRGHLLNWTDVETCGAMEPLFVSTVDSGNLVASLWTLKQAAVAFAREAPPADRLWTGIRDLARLLNDSTDPGAQALAERVLRVDAGWQDALPQLEALARHYAGDLAAAPVGAREADLAWWANELVERLSQARAWLATGLTPATREDLGSIVERADQLVGEMDFTFLYNLRKKTLSVGYDSAAATLESSTYDLLASEARIAAFVAIAKGDVPQDSWFHLGRTHVASKGTRVLVSWTGTMFEYLMPAIWMRHYSGTLLHDSMKSVVRLQQAFTRGRGLPWGISESGCMATERTEYGYAAFGLPDVALNPRGGRRLVISPYSSFLALLVDPQRSVRNLRRIDALGWKGTYGLYEAVDVSDGQPVPVRMWMAHHQGMSLLAVCNVLCDNVLQQHFHAEPQVLATELLLHERVPTMAIADLEEWLVPPRSVAEESAV